MTTKKLSSNEDGDKDLITFDTESIMFEEVKAAAANINSMIPEDSPFINIKNRFNEVYNFFVNMYNNNQILLQNAQQSNATIIMNTNKIKAMLKIMQKDSNKLDKYKREYEKATSVLKSLYESEKKSRELLTNLSKTVTTLKSQVQRGEAFCYGEEDSIALVLSDLKNLKSEKAKGEEEINELKNEIQNNNNIIKKMNEEINNMDNSSKDIENQIKNYQNKIDKIESEVEETRNEIETIAPIVKEQKEKVNENMENLQTHEATHKDLVKQNNDIGKLLLELIARSKIIKHQITQFSKQHNKILKRQANLQEQKELLTQQAEMQQMDMLDKKNQIDILNENISSNQETLNIANTAYNEIEEKKTEVRQKGRELRDELFKLAHDEVIVNNETRRTVRQIHSTSHAMAVVQTNLIHVKHDHSDLQTVNNELHQQKKSKKRKMQGDKIKIRLYEKEIENKKYEKIKINAKCNLVYEDKGINESKIVEDNKYLDSLNIKLEMQSELADQTREERNQYKKKYLIAAKEYTELIKNYGDLSVEVAELEQKNRMISVKAADEHFLARALKQRLVIMEEEVEELREKVYHAHHSITGLEAERKLMQKVINEAFSDKLLIQKELNSVGSNKKSVTGTIIKRKSVIDELKGTVATLISRIERGKKEYREILQKIDVLLEEYDKVKTKNEDLELKVERLKFDKQEGNRMFNLYIQETKKNSMLIQEINLLRNIHRWQMYGATDPGYQRNIYYLNSLYEKLAKAHSVLEKLHTKRDTLKNQLQEAKKKIAPPNNAESEISIFQSHMRKYKRDLEEKEKMIDSMLKEIRSNRVQMKNMNNGVGEIRGKCSHRRISVSQLRSRELALKVEKRQQLLYMTEPETVVPLGGGFIQRLPTPIHIESNTALTIEKSKTPRKQPIHTPRTAKSKKIMRPSTNQRKRPQTSMATIH